MRRRMISPADGATCPNRCAKRLPGDSGRGGNQPPIVAHATPNPWAQRTVGFVRSPKSPETGFRGLRPAHTCSSPCRTCVCEPTTFRGSRRVGCITGPTVIEFAVQPRPSWNGEFRLSCLPYIQYGRHLALVKPINECESARRLRRDLNSLSKQEVTTVKGNYLRNRWVSPALQLINAGQTCGKRVECPDCGLGGST